MDDSISRRQFAAFTAAGALASAGADDAPTPPRPTEAPFERDYPAPDFVPSWKKPQLSRLMVQDFVIFAHSDPSMTEKLLAREPALALAAMDWGAGDFETGLGGASHMGRRDIVEILLKHGARLDLFCAAMMGRLDIVKSALTLEPRLVDAKGPHGFTLHFHAQVGGKEAEDVLAYLQSVKPMTIGPNPFLRTMTPPAKP